MDKRSLITESVAATWIDIHPTGEESDRHIVRTTVGEVPTKLKLGLCSRDEVLAPSNAWPDRHSGLSHSPSYKPPRSREGQFDKVITRLLGLSCPIKTRQVVSTNQSLSSGPKQLVLNQHRRRLPHRDLEIATTLSRSFPFWVSRWSSYLLRPI
jgi:hypothetical protein